MNWREQIWPAATRPWSPSSPALADIVLVGGDEASRVFGTDDVAALRRCCPAPSCS